MDDDGFPFLQEGEIIIDGGEVEEPAMGAVEDAGFPFIEEDQMGEIIEQAMGAVEDVVVEEDQDGEIIIAGGEGEDEGMGEVDDVAVGEVEDEAMGEVDDAGFPFLEENEEGELINVGGEAMGVVDLECGEVEGQAIDVVIDAELQQ